MAAKGRSVTARLVGLVGMLTDSLRYEYGYECGRIPPGHGNAVAGSIAVLAINAEQFVRMASAGCSASRTSLTRARASCAAFLFSLPRMRWPCSSRHNTRRRVPGSVEYQHSVCFQCQAESGCCHSPRDPQRLLRDHSSPANLLSLSSRHVKAGSLMRF